jgi:Rrf2 family protein
MKLTSASTYALHALAHMANEGEDRLVSSHAIAVAAGLPERYLLKVLRPLVSARILHSLKGPNGGYRLARPASQITLLNVIEAVDGPIRGMAPDVEATGKGSNRVTEQLVAVCDRTAELVRQRFRLVSVQDLIGKAK